MNSENSRLKHFRKSLGMTQELFSKSLEVKQSSISDIERGKVKVSAGIFSRLIKKYRLNPFWLSEGAGIMQLSHAHYILLTRNQPYSVQQDVSLVEDKHSVSVQNKNLLLLNTSFDAYINLVLDRDRKAEDFLQFPSLYLPEITGEGRTFQVTSDRMLPTLAPSDYIACTRVSYPSAVITNGIYVTVSKQYGILAGRCSYHENSKTLKLSGDNRSSSKGISLNWTEVAELWVVRLRITSIITDPYESRLKALEKIILKGK